MKIAVFSPWFFPHVGGVETVVALLAEEFSRLGHDVTLITSFPSSDPEQARSYRVLRRVNVLTEVRAVRQADLMLMFLPSLKHIWIPLLLRKPLIVNHPTWLTLDTRPVVARLQQLVCRFVLNVAPSHEVAKAVHPQARFLPNPYDSHSFRVINEVAQVSELVYLGRLVPEKGIDTLLEALTILKNKGVRPRLTVIGSGHFEETLKVLASRLKISDQVTWRNTVTGQDLVTELNRHRIMVVPSKWNEPFGITALEGLACGCRLVVSRGGGLLQATGTHAIVFENGSAESLAQALSLALTEAQMPKAISPALQAHLSQFETGNAASQYLGLMQRALDS